MLFFVALCGILLQYATDTGIRKDGTAAWSTPRRWWNVWWVGYRTP